MLPSLRCQIDPHVPHQRNCHERRWRDRSSRRAADLTNAGRRFLPHYRYIHYYRERSGPEPCENGGQSWQGYQSPGYPSRSSTAKNREIRFKHLKAWTKGMKVVWKFRTPGGRSRSANCSRPPFFRVPPLCACRGTYHRWIFHQLHCLADPAAHESPRGEKMRRVVITGVGPITPIGIGKEAFWKAIKDRKVGYWALSRRSTLRSTRPPAPAEISNWSPETIFPPTSIETVRPFCTIRPWRPSNSRSKTAVLDYSPDIPACGGESVLGPRSAAFPMPRANTKPLSMAGQSPSDRRSLCRSSEGRHIVTQRLSSGFAEGVVETTNSNSCASGNVAMRGKPRYIRDDWADVMIAGAAEAPLSPLTYGAFAFIRTMSRSHPSVACRPFDQDRDGFVMGEGAASLVLEEYEHAKARDAHIYAEVIGYSLNNDAFHMRQHPCPPAILACERFATR